MKKLLILLVMLVAVQGAAKAQLTPNYWPGFDHQSLAGNVMLQFADEISSVVVFDTTRSDGVYILMWTSDSTIFIAADKNQLMGPYRDPQVMVANGEAFWLHIEPPKEEEEDKK